MGVSLLCPFLYIKYYYVTKIYGLPTAGTVYGAGKKEEVQYLGYQCSTQEGMYFTEVCGLIHWKNYVATPYLL